MPKKPARSKFTFVKPTIEQHDIDQSQFNELVSELQSGMREICGYMPTGKDLPKGRVDTALRSIYEKETKGAPLPSVLIREYAGYRLGYDVPVGNARNPSHGTPARIEIVTLETVEDYIREFQKRLGDKLGSEVAKKICATVDTSIQELLNPGKSHSR